MTRLLVVVAAVVALVACAGTAAGAEWHVDDDGGADFTNIQGAVNAAAAGDTIYVHEGTYYENVDVWKRVTLIGDGADVVTVRSISTNHVFEVTADWVNISMFKVTGTTNKTGIHLHRVDHCNISDNNCSNNYNGIFLLYSNNNSISSNICSSNNLEGIYLCHSNNNSISNNIGSNNYGGIWLWSSNNNNISNNSCPSNNVDGIGLGCSNNNSISNNTCSNNDDGIFLLGSNNNNIFNNICSSNDIDGIWLYDSSSNNSITGNTIASNDDAGIRLDSAPSNIVYHNNLIDNDPNGYDDAGANNSWDNSPVDGGNYWSDHTCDGNPSNGSQPYYIDNYGVDQYPFEDPIGEIPPLPSPQPKSEIHVHKKEYLSTNDTYIDHTQIYNFTTELWDVNVWDVESLDNVTYTITTSKNFIYIDNWEMYPNGTENTFILPPTVEGQNYTWRLPLKDRIGSEISFVLDSSQTVQDTPWADMDVSTTDENGYTRVNVTFTPVIPIDWINFRVGGDQIIDVSAYPPEFEIEPTSTPSYVRFDSGDITQDHVYNFSVLWDNPKKVKLELYTSFGWVEEQPSNAITLPVAELGSITVKADVPVIWEHAPTQPECVQSIKINMSGWLTTPQKGDLNGDDDVTAADAAIALQLAVSGAHNPAADISGDGHVTSLDALMILQASNGVIDL